MNEFDSDGYYVWSCIVDYGYLKHGYYFDTNDKDKLELFASEYCRKKLSLVKEVIAGCLRRDLFNKAVYELSGILTCEMMQEVFLYGTAERRKKGAEFEIRKEWLLLDFGDQIPVNLIIVPGNNEIDHGKNPQTETETKTETKKIVTADEPPAPVKKVFTEKKLKQKNDSATAEPEPFWNSLVKVWFDFNKEKFGDDPSFDRDEPRILKRLIGRLRKRAEAKKMEWSEVNAILRFSKFLDECYQDPWLCTHFLLDNLEKQFDTVILNHKKNGNQNRTSRQDHTHRAVITGDAQSAGTL